jgi:hypothetical protein
MTGGDQQRRKSGWGIPWSHEELEALEPYVKGRIRGKYRNCWHAARAYQAEADESPSGQGGRPARRTLKAISSQIWKRVQGRKWRMAAAWSQEELRVVDRHVRSVARARVGHRSIRAATRFCESALRRLHAAYPSAAWAQRDRTWQAIQAELSRRARRLGLRGAGSHWTLQEDSIIEPYAQALARGRFDAAPDAAGPCLEKLERMRSRNPRLAARRTLGNVTVRIRQLAHRLGWAHFWTPQELRALEPFALGLVRGRYRSTKAAVAAFLSRPHPSRASKPGSSPTVAPRPASGILHAMGKRARALGRPRRDTLWSREEARRLDSYAERVAKGRISCVAQAAREFLIERRQLRRRRPDASRLNVRRTQKGVYAAIWKRVRRL